MDFATYIFLSLALAMVGLGCVFFYRDVKSDAAKAEAERRKEWELSQW